MHGEELLLNFPGPEANRRFDISRITPPPPVRIWIFLSDANFSTSAYAIHNVSGGYILKDIIEPQIPDEVCPPGA